MDIDWQAVIDIAREVGPVGVVVIVIVLGVVALYVLRGRGLLPAPAASRTPVAAMDGIKAELGQINKRLGNVDDRLTSVEHDLEDRPTREDITEIKIALARREEQAKASDREITAIARGVNRMEDFLISLSKGK